MSDDVNADFGRLQGTAQTGVSGFNAAGRHPLFSAAHSFILAHKYGQADPQTYMRNPGLRQMDTRQAAMEGLQKAGQGVRRWADYYRPSIPGPVGTVPSPTTPAPKVPQNYSYSNRSYSKPMTAPGTPL